MTGHVVIIGGGIIGCSLAFHLAKYGHPEVTVLEAGLLGDGATGKATGGIRQQFSSPVNAAIAHQAVGYFRDFEPLVGEPFAFRQHGYLFLLSTPGQHEQFSRAVAMQQAAGIDAEIVGTGKLGQLVPGLDTGGLLGGAYCRSDGSGSPADALAAFARQARRRGVRFAEHTRVRAVTPAAGGFEVHAGEDSFRAGVVVNAAGPWAHDVGAMAGLDLPVEPHPRQAFGIGPLPQLDPAMPLTVDLASGAYVHPEAHGGIVGGGDRDTPASYQAPVRWPLAGTVIEALTRRIPWMAEAEIRSSWCGLREMTPDDHAIVGPCDVPNWWNVVGFSGHGFMQAPVIGDRVARWMLGQADGRGLEALRLGRFAGKPTAEPEAESAVF
ncbi:MAG TPA: FAD-binding oxidoreductase [Streptosporangiaceae bacterium]